MGAAASTDVTKNVTDASDAQALEALTIFCSNDPGRANRLFAEAQSNAQQLGPDEQPPRSDGGEAPTLGAAHDDFDQRILLEHNWAREQPVEYARHRVSPLLHNFEGNRLRATDGQILITTEGRKAVEELLVALKEHQPCRPLRLEPNLSRSAQRHAEDARDHGITAHVGSDGSTVQARIEQEGEWWGACGENISLGHENAEDVVLWLLIDDGVPSRGHRKNILDPQHAHLGCSKLVEHKNAGKCVVLDYTAGFGPPRQKLDHAVEVAAADLQDQDTLAILASLPHGLDQLREEIETTLTAQSTDGETQTVSLTYTPGRLEVKFVVQSGNTITTKTKAATWT